MDANMRQRMLIGFPTERYRFLKQNFLLSPAATRPNLDALKAQLRDIDSDFRKPQGQVKTKSGQGHRAETEANWGQKSNSGSDKRREKFLARGGSSSGQGGRGGRSSSDRISGDDHAGASKSGGDVTCYCSARSGLKNADSAARRVACKPCASPSPRVVRPAEIMVKARLA